MHEGGPERCMIGVVLVCGGRDYSDRERVFRVLDRVAQRVEISAIRHGAARGADALAGEWARARGIPEQPFPADWRTHGKRAGPLRNAAMLAEQGAGTPDRVVVCGVAFPGGGGTADMVRRMVSAKLPVWGVP